MRRSTYSRILIVALIAAVSYSRWELIHARQETARVRANLTKSIETCIEQWNKAR